VTRLAVLRPEPGNARTAAAIEAAGASAIRVPLFAVVPLPWTMPAGRFDALLVTSANAMRHGGAGLAALTGLAVLAVGRTSAAAAREAGFTVEATGTADARALVASAGAGRRLLHLGGRERVMLEGVAAVTVYAAEPLPVDRGTIASLAGSVALLHSARGAARFAELAEAAGVRGTIRLAGLSAAVIDAAGSGWRSVAAAGVPRDGMLVALALTLAD
jgi:uroporphyrinogen-III synthase